MPSGLKAIEVGIDPAGRVISDVGVARVAVATSIIDTVLFVGLAV